MRTHECVCRLRRGCELGASEPRRRQRRNSGAAGQGQRDTGRPTRARPLPPSPRRRACAHGAAAPPRRLGRLGRPAAAAAATGTFCNRSRRRRWLRRQQARWRRGGHVRQLKVRVRAQRPPAAAATAGRRRCPSRGSESVSPPPPPSLPLPHRPPPPSPPASAIRGTFFDNYSNYLKSQTII